MWIAANRDSTIFTDPDRVLIDRDRDGNLLFGSGIHRCLALGEPLALLNLRVGVGELLRKAGPFELAASGAPVPSVIRATD